MQTFKWKVLRRHQGDRMYAEGEIREGTQADLGHLSPSVLQRIDDAKSPSRSAAKSEPAPINKAEPPPANKAETTKRNADK